MPLIIPSADLRNNYNKISKRCHETKEPIYVTRNGVNDLVVLSDEVFEKMRKQNEESEEEKREREARDNGNAIGAVVGSAIGLLSMLDSDCDEDSDETESEENTFGLFM